MDESGAVTAKALCPSGFKHFNSLTAAHTCHPMRSRRLLMHKREIRKLHALVKQDGYALVPLAAYFKDARVKLEIGLCKGKKNYDKRAATAARDAKREIDRTMKERNR